MGAVRRSGGRVAYKRRAVRRGGGVSVQKGSGAWRWLRERTDEGRGHNGRPVRTQPERTLHGGATRIDNIDLTRVFQALEISFNYFIIE